MNNKPVLIIGGAKSVYEDLEYLQNMVNPYKLDDVFYIHLINDQIHTWPHRVDFYSSLHGEKVEKWFEERKKKRNQWNFITFIHRIHKWKDQSYCNMDIREVKDKWRGSSGLYAVQVTHEQLGLDKMILAGIPMSDESNLFREEDSWSQFAKYRKGWNHVQKLVKNGNMINIFENVRSTSGWTADKLGKPTKEFILEESN